MKTDDLIRMMAADPAPRWRFGPILRAAVAGGVLLSAVLFFAMLGFRPDIAQALGSPRFLFKFVVTIALAVTATLAIAAIGRPGVPVAVRLLLLALVPALLAGGVALELMALPERQWMPSMIGHNARFCLTLIPLLAIGPLACFLAALRRGAPSNPGLAGAVAGLAASGIAATFYAANCEDDSPLFVMLWYTIAVAMVTAVGYLLGRRLLRW